MDTKKKKPRALLAVLAGLLVLVACMPLTYGRPQSAKPQALPQDEACLACHGQPGMKSEAGKVISIDPGKHAASAHGILGCKDCHTTIKDFPHPAKVPKVKCATCHAEQAADAAKSIHAVLGEAACSSCHGNVHEVAAAPKLQPEKCAECHAQEVQEFRESIHGQAEASGDPDAPKCSNCHGPVHKILPSGDAAATASKKNLPDTCAVCHSNGEFLSRHKIPIAHPVEKYRQSVHGLPWKPRDL
jgi:protein-arginine kinase activator protein McsA